jgi:ATP-dependent RNA helicase DeaD
MRRSSGNEVPLEKGMERFRMEVGRNHDVQPGNIVGAIANEAGIDGEYIGRVSIHDDYSLIDLPEGMPNHTFNILKKTRVSGHLLQISRVEGESPPRSLERRAKHKGKGRKRAETRPGQSSKRKVRKSKPGKP